MEMISRQGVLDLFDKYHYTMAVNVLKFQKELQELPILSETKEGHWVDYDGPGYFANCSECGYQIDVHENRGYFTYCPNCGSKMR